MAQLQRTVFFTDCVAVFQGGGCRGAAFAGAFAAATDAGIGVAGVAGTSAGAIMASLIGAGADATYTTNILNSLDFAALLQPPVGQPSHPIINSCLKPLFHGRLDGARKFLFYGGQYSPRPLEDWVDQRLAELLPAASRPIRFRDLSLPTWVIATDLLTRRARVWCTGQDDQEPVAHAVSASCALPAFFQPVDGRYVDGGVISNLPTFAVGTRERSAPRRILAFTLRDSTNSSPDLKDPSKFLGTLADAIVNGAQDLQLQLERGFVNEIRIDCGDIKATDFNRMNNPLVEFLRNQGRLAAEHFFRNEATEVYPESSAGRITTADLFETNAQVAKLFLSAHNRIIVSSSDSKWVYELSPALLVARYKSVQVNVLIPPNSTSDPKEAYRRQLLQRLGVCLVETNDLPPPCFIVDPEQSLRAAAVMLTEAPSRHAAVYHSSEGHEAVVQVLYKDFEKSLEDAQGSENEVPTLESVLDSFVTKSLRAVPQYSGPSIVVSMEDVSLDQVSPLHVMLLRSSTGRHRPLPECFGTRTFLHMGLLR